MANHKIITNEFDDIISWCEQKVNKRRFNNSINKLEQKGYEEAMSSVIAYLRTKKQDFTFIKPCIECGELFETLTDAKKYCDKCRSKVMSNRAKERELHKIGNRANVEKGKRTREAKQCLENQI